MNFSNCSKQGEFIIITGVKKQLTGLFLLYNNNLFSRCLSSILPSSQNAGMERKAGFTIMSVFAFLFYLLARTMLQTLLMQFSLSKKDPKQNTTNQTVMESLKLYVCSDNLQLVLSPLHLPLSPCPSIHNLWFLTTPSKQDISLSPLEVAHIYTQ